LLYPLEALTRTGKVTTRRKVEWRNAMSTNPPWFVIDKEGLRKTLSRKGKAFAIFELLQNGFDADATKVEITLGEPKDGKSILICDDNAPLGYVDMSNAHTMFGESAKKTDVHKRGRFNVGEKYVLALCDKATIISKTGRTMFHEDGTRTHDTVKTEAGTTFTGFLPLTMTEYNDMVQKVGLVIPPVPTYFNGKRLPERKVLHEFTAQLPTELADENGILRSKKRTVTIRLYETPKGGGAWLYEMGMPVVLIDCKWSVDIQQKVPLNIERDNVTPSYLKAVYQAILDERSDYLTEDDAAAAWVTTGLSSPKVSIEAVKAVVEKRFGKDAVIYDRNDLGANREAVARGRMVIPRGAMTPELRKNFERAGVEKSSAKYSTASTPVVGLISEENWTPAMRRYQDFIVKVAPLVLQHELKGVQFENNPEANHSACTQWQKASYIFTVNVAFHDVEDWRENYDTFIHELAHHAVQRNDHLFEGFYNSVTDIGAKLAEVALAHPELFPMTNWRVEFTPVESDKGFEAHDVRVVQRTIARQTSGVQL
jgi:hypothetical protein